MQCTHCMFRCLLPLVINTKSLQNLSITWERNVLVFFLSLSAPSVTHPPLSSTLGGFSRGTEVVERAPLLHGAPPIVQLHIDLSPHVRSQVGFCYPTSYHFIQTLAEKAFFCLKKTNSIKSSETPELHLLQPLIDRGGNICDFRLDFKAGATIVTAPIQRHFHVVSVCVMTLLGQRGDTNSTLQKKGAFHQMRRASLPLQTGCGATGLMMELTS